MSKPRTQIDYLDSFSADTSIVPTVINHLMQDLRELTYPQEDIEEIVLSMDESITNAVQETLHSSAKKERTPDHRDITIRYSITLNEFDATIIDHGLGLDIFNILSSLPNRSALDYHEQIHQYVDSANSYKIKVRVNGEEVPIRGIGAGLKIILTFMDAVTIDLFDREKILSSSITEHTDGTILNLKRQRRY